MQVFVKEVSETYMLRVMKRATGRKPRLYAKRKGLWKGLPRDTRWYLTEFDSSEFQRVSLIRNEPNWLALGGYLREPAAAARWIQDHADLDPGTIAFHRRMRRGEFPDFPIVLVGPTRKPWDLVCLDGNHRLTAACMGDVPGLAVLIGISKHMRRWEFYRDRGRLRRELNELAR